MGGESSKSEPQALEIATDHEAGINCMTISDDGSLLITGSDDRTARMWSTVTDYTECIGILKGHTKEITCLAVGDTYLFTGSADATIRKWDMTQLECVFVYEGHKSRISTIVVTQEYMFSTSSDKTARCWMYDTDDLKDQDSDGCQRIFSGHAKGISSLVYVPAEELGEDEASSSGDLVITASFDSNAISWSLDKGEPMRVFRDHTQAIICMVRDKEFNILFTGSRDKTIRSWSILTGTCLTVFLEQEGAIVSLCLHKGTLFSGAQNGHARSFISDTGEEVRQYLGHTNTVNALQVSKGLLFTACGDTVARVYDAVSGGKRKEFTGHENAIISLAVVNNKFYTGSTDGTLRCWDISTIPISAAYDEDNNEDFMEIREIQIDSDQDSVKMEEKEDVFTK